MNLENNKKRKFEYEKMSNNKIKELALNIYKDNVFTNIGLSENDVRTVFQVINFFDEETFKFITENPPGLIYEYMSKMSPTLVNGLPIFSSVRFVSQEDTIKVFEKLNVLINIYGKKNV